MRWAKSFSRHLGMAVWLLGTLVSCGGGGGDGAISASGSAGGAAVGTVTGFGSVFVNGTEYDTGAASISADGQGGQSQSALKLGMVVIVNYTRVGTARRAASIVHRDVLEGPIASINLTTQTFVVLGQTVLVDTSTKFDAGITPPNLNGLRVGDVVEVSGFVQAGGVIAATFIERKVLPPGAVPDFEVHGIVQSHNPGAPTFQIGALTVNYATADITDMPDPSSVSWNGLLVEVKGSGFNASNELIATKVELKQDLPGVAQLEVEVEGFVTEVLAPTEFKIGNTLVRITSATRFEGGTADEVAVGVKLEVEGAMANGILVAEKIEFKDSARLEGNIKSVNVADNTFVLDGLGITVMLTNDTRLKDTTGLTGADPLAVGDHVRVRGRVSPATTTPNTVIASRVEQRSPEPDPEVILQGAVQSINKPLLTILGVTADTTGAQFEGVDDAPINQDTFFNLVKVGSIVKAKGSLLPGGTIQWKEFEPEDE